MRRLFVTRGTISSSVVTGREADGAKYRDYFDWEESAATAPSHRVLALFRGEKEGFLKLKLGPPDHTANRLLSSSKR